MMKLVEAFFYNISQVYFLQDIGRYGLLSADMPSLTHHVRCIITLILCPLSLSFSLSMLARVIASSALYGSQWVSQSAHPSLDL